MNTEHVKKKHKKRKGKLNIIHRRLTHNYILTTKKTNETKTQYLLASASAQVIVALKYFFALAPAFAY